MLPCNAGPLHNNTVILFQGLEDVYKTKTKQRVMAELSIPSQLPVHTI